MARVVELNRGPLLGEPVRARTVTLPAADAQVLDVRDGASFADGHLGGSFNDSVAVSGFGNRCGFALDPEREVVIVAATHEQADDAVRKLAAVGFTQLAEVGFGIDSAHSLERFEPIGLVTMGQLADKGELQVVDVREASEQSELATGALAVPYRLLAEADLSSLDPARPTAVVCSTGTRTPLAASLLARRGFTHVRPVLGEGMNAWGTREAVAAAEAEEAATKAEVQGEGLDVFGDAARERAVRRQRHAQGERRVGPVASVGASPRSSQPSTAATCPAHGSALTTSTRRIGPSAGCTRRRLAAWSTPPMLPPSAAGAALNGYSTTPRSQSTRRLLENG